MGNPKKGSVGSREKCLSAPLWETQPERAFLRGGGGFSGRRRQKKKFCGETAQPEKCLPTPYAETKNGAPGQGGVPGGKKSGAAEGGKTPP